MFTDNDIKYFLSEQKHYLCKYINMEQFAVSQDKNSTNVQDII